MTHTSTQILDMTGKNCPVPIFRTQIAIRDMNEGELLEVHATDPQSVKDFTVYCSQTGNTLVSSENNADQYVFLIRKN